MFIFPVIFLFLQLSIVLFLLLFISNCSVYFIFYMLPSGEILLSFAVLTIFFILSLRYVKNPIYILLSIVFSFILLSFLLFDKNCELLTYTFIIVYLGALMLLFLFIVMLLNIQSVQKNTTSILSRTVYIIFFTNFFIFMLYLIFETLPVVNTLHNFEFTSLFFYNEVCCNDIVLIKLFQKPMLILFLLIATLLLFILISSITTINAIKNTRIIQKTTYKTKKFDNVIFYYFFAWYIQVYAVFTQSWKHSTDFITITKSLQVFK